MTRLETAAEKIGGYVWLEERLFEVLGGWVADEPKPGVKLLFAADSHHHAWHAALWRERLPELAEMPSEGFVGPGGDGLARFVATLSSSATTLERLVGVYRVAVPYLVGTYSRHLECSSPITDGPTIRTLNLVLADELTDWREGEIQIQALVAEVADVHEAAAHQARLWAILVNGGGGRESNPPDGDRPSQPL